MSKAPGGSVTPARVVLLAGTLLAGSVAVVRDAAYSGAAIGASSLLAMAAGGYGLRRYHPVSARFWKLLLWALGVGAVGGAMTAAVPQQSEVSYLTDVVYLFGFTLFVIAALTLQPARHGRRDWAGILDALTVAIAAAMLFWYFAVSSVLSDEVTFHAITSGVIWPFYDLVLLVVVSRMLSSKAPRDFVFLALTGALLFSVLSDFLFAATASVGEYVWGSSTDALWVMPMVLIGAAGVHPAMRTFSGGRSASPFEITWARVFVVGLVAFSVPLLLSGHATSRGTLLDEAPALLWLTAVLVLVNMARTAEMVRQSRLITDDFQCLNGELRSVLSERDQLHKELNHRALHDPLTGLPNRRHLRELLEAASEGDDWPQMALFFIDLDDFKELNDSLGHAAGDRALCEIGRRVRAVLRPEETVARLGGDEFAVVITGVEPVFVELLGLRLLETICAPMQIDDSTVTMSASLGLAWGREGVDPDGLLRDADIAMYASKGRGKNRMSAFEQHMREGLQDRTRLQSKLAEALGSGELRVAYQPVVHLEDGTADGVEALVRWTPPDGEVIAAAMVIRLAEESGQIFALGRYVLAQAAAQVRTWREQGLTPNMAVNVSSLQLRDPDLLAAVAAAVAEFGPEQVLILEITESALVLGSDEELALLEELRRLGCRIAIDDFGTGFSSLAYLTRLPVDIVKIDRLFVEQIDNGPSGVSVAQAIISLGDALGYRVIAEGVERQNEADILRGLGCKLAQGYLFARPGWADEVGVYLRDHQRGSVVPSRTHGNALSASRAEPA